ncbi:ABC transporter substrate-binding protein [Georgenia sunbinii]|uniref:ABC transporter substrate-binding protein n=1 Tax=Georgenia sunbinii TaxID=3117728 RepID=UPI002F263A60
MRHHSPLRRRGVAATSLLGVLALGAAACSGPSTSAAEEVDDGAADTVDWSQVEPASEITWWSNHPGAAKELEEQFIAEFEAAHPDITVNLVTAGASYDEIAQRFQAAAGTDEQPDLVIASDVWWFRYHLNEQIVPLDELLEAIDADAEDYVPALYADYEFEGQHWAAPYARSTPLFYYNQDMWQAAGLPDRGPETWEELASWADALDEQVPDDGAPFGLRLGASWSAWWFQNMLWGQGGNYSDSWDVTLDTPEALAGGQFVHDLFHGSQIATVSEDTAADLAGGIIASTIMSTGSLAGVLEATPDMEIGTAYLPDGPNGEGTPTGGTGVAIASSSTPEEQLAAAMFLEFLTNAENTAVYSAATGYMPVRTSAVDGPQMEALYGEIPQFRTAVDHMADKARPQDWVRVFVPTADQLLTDALEEIVLRGTDPAAAFEQITPQIERAYEENVEPYL